MRKAQIVDKIAKNTSISKVDVLVTVEAFMQEVKNTLKSGENIYLRGFGTFESKLRKAKKGQNIKKGIQVYIPEKRVPKFKPAKEFKID